MRPLFPKYPNTKLDNMITNVIHQLKYNNFSLYISSNPNIMQAVYDPTIGHTFGMSSFAMDVKNFKLTQKSVVQWETQDSNYMKNGKYPEWPTDKVADQWLRTHGIYRYVYEQMELFLYRTAPSRLRAFRKRYPNEFSCEHVFANRYKKGVKNGLDPHIDDSEFGTVVIVVEENIIDQHLAFQFLTANDGWKSFPLGTLPYIALVFGARYHCLPNGIRQYHRFSLSFFFNLVWKESR